MRRLLPHFRNDRARLREIRVALALGLQFRSGRNILRFYSLREDLADARRPAGRIEVLGRMRKLVRDELAVDAELLKLSESEPLLGFVSEAEGYKYYPALIRWRMGQLRRLLTEEFPAVARRARREGPLFPDYTGERPAGPAYRCARARKTPSMDGRPFGGAWDGLPQAECTHWLRQVFNAKRWRKCGYDFADHLPVAARDRGGRETVWKACHDRNALYIGMLCKPGTGEADPASAFKGNGLQVFVEPERTQPRIIFFIGPNGHARCVKDDNYIPRKDDPWRACSAVGEHGWSAVLRVPFKWLGLDDRKKRKPIRINVVRTLPVPGKAGQTSCSWAKREPAQGRLVWGFHNPATDFGWLRFEG
jgi:hypothetical protein